MIRLVFSQLFFDLIEHMGIPMNTHVIPMYLRLSFRLEGEIFYFKLCTAEDLSLSFEMT